METTAGKISRAEMWKEAVRWLCITRLSIHGSSQDGSRGRRFRKGVDAVHAKSLIQHVSGGWLGVLHYFRSDDSLLS